jgi:tetraacyldisaccharide-1-P 4'-kinase
LLTTEKDYLRIDKEYRESINCLKVKVEIENKNKFIEEIKKFI